MARGRGRLSSFDLLPPEADDLVSWAASELADREKTQVGIYHEFVARAEELKAEHGGALEFEVPSLSAFNRYSIRQAMMTARLDQTREIVKVLAAKHDAKTSDDLTIMAGELIKSVVFHMLGDVGDTIMPKEIKALADAIRSAQSAQNMSSDRKASEDKRIEGQLSAAVDAVAKTKGLTAETTEDIKKQILGVM